jgi:hypothetical protein
MEKYGFVYIWYDKKHKRYYIGCHWGLEDDGYICSSPWMNQGYKHRPKDFRRRILSRVYTNKKDLLQEEYNWLSQIKKEELGRKYYNVHNRHFNHWSADEEKRSVAIGKMRRTFSEEHKRKISEAKKSKIRTEEAKRKTSETLKNRPQSKELIEKRVQSRKDNGNYTMSKEQKKKISEFQIGKRLSEEHKMKIAGSLKQYFANQVSL